MKTKKINTKLTLNKKTIANLEGKDMKRINGGKATDLSNNPWVCCIPPDTIILCPTT